MNLIKRFLREPLAHFLVLGAALFGLYSLLNRNPASSPDTLVVTAGQIENLTATFANAWQRPPTAIELKGLIDQHVKEEILSREAIKLGLDQNDTIIRRRLQQKMEFLAEDFATAREPTEAELADYLAKHPEDFRQEQRFAFRQVFLNPEKHGDPQQAAAAMLASLKQNGVGADISALGDRLLLPAEFNDESQHEVSSQFGQEFAEALGQLKAGEWIGPVRSGYGIHLVFVIQRTDDHLLALEEVREQVKRDLVNTRRLEANRKFLDGLLARYHVTIESPKAEVKTDNITTAMNR